ncbi:MAG TPA: hypothetical protein DD434_09805 [Bacteroidales bacterium]|nr:hypothetical protein [Bacteroidales bacterium]
MRKNNINKSSNVFKALSLALVLFFIGINSTNINAQPYKSNVQSSKEPWRYGVRAGLSYDNVTVKQGVNYKFGWKAGLVAEKRLVYNLYFQPSLSFQNKGFRSEIPSYEKVDVNAYLLEGVLGLLIKFGDERKGSGLYISASPYFTYGIGGKTDFVDLRSSADSTFYGSAKVNTFANDLYQPLDIGFQLGLGYDLNHKLSIGTFYYFGMQKMRNDANYRWKGFQIHLSFFFK